MLHILHTSKPGILGFLVLSVISVGAGLMQVTMQCAHPAWPAKTNKRMVKEIEMHGDWNF